MNNVKKLLALLLALVMVVGMLAACGGSGSETPDAGEQSGEQSGDAAASNPNNIGPGTYGGHLNVRSTARFNGLDPLKQTGTWKYQFTTCVFENALTRDNDNNICPGVCDFELSEDMLTLKLWVRENMKFHNGDTVDIYDVEASINRSLSLYNSCKSYVTPYVESVTVDGDTLTMQFTEYQEKVLYYIAAYQTWMAIMPKEVCEKYTDTFVIDQIEDAIGTGPYKYAEFEDSVQITLEKFADYVPQVSEATGHAGPKYGYMDTITFWFVAEDATAANGLLGGQYDMVEVIPAEYEAMAEQKGLGVQVLPSNQSTFIIFNNKSNSSAVSKYPALRKAIMAAIDYETLLSKITDDSYTNEYQLSILEKYQTTAFNDADYFGEANQAVVDKYLAEAKAQGYNDEPVTIVAQAARTDILTMLGDALAKAGINYKPLSQESATFTSYVKEPANEWDLYFTWQGLPAYPSLIQDAIVRNNWDSAERDRILSEMAVLKPDSAEYMALFNELAQLMADECPVGVLSIIDWWWWCPTTLHVESDSPQQYIYNTWWEDPQNHTR